jgi:hypothetical protein
MRQENYAKSMNDVVNTTGAVLQTFINDVVKEEMPDCNYVYDPQLTFESSMALIRAANNKLDRNQFQVKPSIPLFAFSHSALKYSEDITSTNKRMANNVGHYKTESGNHYTYATFHGEIELQFLYVNTSMRELDKFAITYLSNEGISGTKQITVNLPDLGDFNYYIEYEDMLDINVNIENVYYKSLAGTIKIRGFYFTFRSEASVIEQINLSIYNKAQNIINSELLSSINIS